LLGIYNETLESLITQEINIELYRKLDPKENIVPKEAVDAGLRAPKTAEQRIKEIEEIIETKKKTIAVVERKLAELNNDDTRETGE